MPKLIRLYIVNVAIGFALALAFVSALVFFDVANLRHLVTGTEMGWLAFVMMVMFNGIVFASVQFAYAVMSLAAPDDGPKGGKKQGITGQLAPVHVGAKRR
jgi:TRAP-type C4-dicarboxylate transport system permease small subunit